MQRTGWTRFTRATGTVAAPRNYFSSLFDQAGRYVELKGQLLAVMPTGFDLKPYRLMKRDGSAFDCWRNWKQPNVLNVNYPGDDVIQLDAETLEPILELAAAPTNHAANARVVHLTFDQQPTTRATYLQREQRLIDAGRNAELCGVRDWRLFRLGVKLLGLEAAILRDGLSQQEIADYAPAMKAARAEYARRVLHLASKGEITVPAMEVVR